MLGAGTFGQVVRCRNIESGRLFGVKVIKSKAAYYTQALAEVGILKYLNRECDPNDERHIVRLKHTFVHKHHLCLVFELLSINLYELLKHNRFRGLPTAIIRTFCEQLLEGLCTLREAGIIHCDLKPENILLKSLKRPQIKIADFGSACRTNERLHTYIQSRFYRSPEVLIGMKYSTPIDMWSLGCILAELFLGVPLFPGTSEYNQLALITHVLGLPPSSMLQQGRYTRHFFNRKVTDGNIQYQLKSRTQYMDETQQVEMPNKKTYSTNDLMDLILTNPMPHKELMIIITNIETRVRLLMADFLSQVLQLDPSRRLTPQGGKLHGFIMSAHSQSRSVHDRSHYGGSMGQSTTLVGYDDLETCASGSPDDGGGMSPRDSGDAVPVAPQTNDSDLLPSYMKKEEAYFYRMPSVARRFTR
ncbi:kinase-like protein [Lichtheimia hyalospora FSU 10163]|nr:kinase-like protein [Lichtheimia hyalospora FSU 10163]